ncbi:hypothetical protein ACFUYE_24830 [Micromonospora humida]|uniref:hypothetical protein n=1 Tax=Micromonospora humida TaxID=2809018 RepID=UPI00366EE58A
MSWEIGISAATGALVTLLSVAAGGWIAERSQKRAWSRATLSDACAMLVQEQATTYMALIRWRDNEIDRVDWARWNAALARVHMVCPPSVVESAISLDEAFWHFSTGIRNKVDEARWFQLRDSVEQRRLDFVNVVRKQLSPAAGALHRLVGKPDETAGPAD